MDGAMSEEHGFGWVDKIFDEKKKLIEQHVLEKKAANLEREKYESLIEEFWTMLKQAVSSAVDVYNSHIAVETDRFRIDTAGNDSLRIQKVTIPRCTLNI